jgi:hypothetical protein
MMKVYAASFMVAGLCVFAVAQKPIAQLPQATVDTTWNQPTGGTTWAAHTSAQLKTALKSALPGDVIVLDAGTIYSGNFVVPAVSNPNGQWIYIESSNLNSLPPTGTQVSPSDAVNMPKIVTPTVSQALAFASGSSYIRMVGIEVYSASTWAPTPYTPGVYYGYALISAPNGGWPISLPIPDHIIFDRCYIHGDPTHDVQVGIQANYSNFAVVDSYISDLHMKGAETNAIGAFFTPGPMYIHNNHLEAAGEDIIFGGSGGSADLWVPSDITITNNYLYKPLSWVPLSSGNNPAYTEKNAFECKSCQRVLFDSNIIQNVWYAAQMGFAIVLTVKTSQSGDIAVVNDITITNNILNNVVSGINTLGEDYACGTTGYTSCHNPGSQDRWYIANNLILFYDPTLQGGNRNVAIAFNGGLNYFNNNSPGAMRDVVFQHNTAVSASSTPCWNSIYFNSNGQAPPFQVPVSNNIWILDNALCRQPTGDYGYQGMAALTNYMGQPSTAPYDVTQRYYGNAMWVQPGDRVQSFPTGNLAQAAAFTYVNPSALNYQLLTPNWTTTSDGQLAGINSSTLP